jgi:hypothetical protein
MDRRIADVNPVSGFRPLHVTVKETAQYGEIVQGLPMVQQSAGTGAPSDRLNDLF